MTVRYYSVRDSTGRQVRQVYDEGAAQDYKSEGMNMVEVVNHYNGPTHDLNEL